MANQLSLVDVNDRNHACMVEKHCRHKNLRGHASFAMLTHHIDKLPLGCSDPRAVLWQDNLDDLPVDDGDDPECCNLQKSLQRNHVREWGRCEPKF